MGFLWVNGFSFFHCVASPFHSFVTTLGNAADPTGCMGFLWVESCSFFHCVVSPFQSFVTTLTASRQNWIRQQQRYPRLRVDSEALTTPEFECGNHVASWV